MSRKAPAGDMKSGIKRFVASVPIMGPWTRSLWRWVMANWLKTPKGQRAAGKRIDDRSRLHDFWRSESPEGNEPWRYLEVEHRSEALLGLVSFLPKEAQILEVGCNVGRNLAHLFGAGYKEVEGIEISPHAVRLLRESYPQLARTRIHVGAAEDILPKLTSDSFDLVFTMAVLEHIHPESVLVFDHIARLTQRVLAIEPRLYHSSHRQFPHDVPALFCSRGFRLVESTRMEDIPETSNDRAMSGYCAWLLERD